MGHWAFGPSHPTIIACEKPPLMPTEQKAPALLRFVPLLLGCGHLLFHHGPDGEIVLHTIVWCIG